MTKGDLINRVAESADLSKAQASAAVTGLLTTIGDALRDGDKVALLGFGTFTPIHKKERPGRNPKTGEAITIAAKTTVKFKAGKELNDAVN